MRSFFQLIAVLGLVVTLQACQTGADGTSGTALDNNGASDAFTYDADGNIIQGDGADLKDSSISSYGVDGKDLAVFTSMPGTPDDARAYDRVFFSYDSAALNADSQRVLSMQADWLNNNDSVSITVEGHADERGTREYNLALGEKRANAVRRYLVAAGVSPRRISVVSFGKERPVAFDNLESAHRKNRRAVTVLKNYR